VKDDHQLADMSHIHLVGVRAATLSTAAVDLHTSVSLLLLLLLLHVKNMHQTK